MAERLSQRCPWPNPLLLNPCNLEMCFITWQQMGFEDIIKVTYVEKEDFTRSLQWAQSHHMSP